MSRIVSPSRLEWLLVLSRIIVAERDTRDRVLHDIFNDGSGAGLLLG
jgi:hypothetical protein